MKKGDIILVPFPFTNLIGNKTRPALVLATDEFDVTVAFITSRIIKKELNDVEVSPTEGNSLKVPSIIKLNKISSIENTLALGKIGELSDTEIASVNESLKTIFGLQ